MPKFFFHVTDGEKAYANATGADLNDAATAETFARIIATELAPEPEYQNYFFVDVRDEQDYLVSKIYISARH